jgi:hypothetical protein
MNFEKIRTCIMNSSIVNDDKMTLVDVFAEIPDELLAHVAELFEKDQTWVEKVNENKKKKEQALATGNKALWSEIMEEEKQYLNKLTYDLD